MNPNETVDRFAKVKKHSMETLKEIIFELSSKCDEVQIQLKRAQTTRASNLSNNTTSAEVQPFGNRGSSQGSAENGKYLLG